MHAIFLTICSEEGWKRFCFSHEQTTVHMCYKFFEILDHIDVQICHFIIRKYSFYEIWTGGPLFYLSHRVGPAWLHPLRQSPLSILSHYSNNIIDLFPNPSIYITHFLTLILVTRFRLSYFHFTRFLHLVTLFNLARYEPWLLTKTKVYFPPKVKEKVYSPPVSISIKFHYSFRSWKMSFSFFY